MKGGEGGGWGGEEDWRKGKGKSNVREEGRAEGRGMRGKEREEADVGWEGGGERRRGRRKEERKEKGGERMGGEEGKGREGRGMSTGGGIGGGGDENHASDSGLKLVGERGRGEGHIRSGLSWEGGGGGVGEAVGKGWVL